MSKNPVTLVSVGIGQFFFSSPCAQHNECYKTYWETSGIVPGLTMIVAIAGGSYVYDFPSMVAVSLRSADAALLVFAVDDQEQLI